MGRLLLALAFICLGSGASAWAQSAREAYVDGAFLEAASLGEAQGQADDLALAADRSNTEARLQLAAAIGMRGRRATIAEAMRKGYAGEGRALVRAAIVEAPREAWAHALEGGWNLEVVRRGGGVGAAYYGASVRAGHAAFERARALAPDDAIIAYQYAVALLELDPERYGAEAARLLAAASACRPADAFETRVKAKAASVATVLSARGPDAAVRLATARFR